MKAKKPSILFVCTANICRSPMAAALFRARLGNEVPGSENWLVDSAGTWAEADIPASENSVKAMSRRKLDISSHRSKEINKALLEKSDLILVMEPGHKEALQVEFPGIAERVFLLSEMSGEAAAVQDPYGRSRAEYERTAYILDQYIQKGMEKILSYLNMDAGEKGEDQGEDLKN
jgi:protein-tyrosine-phosphatase